MVLSPPWVCNGSCTDLGAVVGVNPYLPLADHHPRSRNLPSSFSKTSRSGSGLSGATEGSQASSSSPASIVARRFDRPQQVQAVESDRG